RRGDGAPAGNGSVGGDVEGVIRLRRVVDVRRVDEDVRVVVGPRREALAALLPAAAEEDAGHAAEPAVRVGQGRDHLHVLPGQARAEVDVVAAGKRVRRDRYAARVREDRPVRRGQRPARRGAGRPLAHSIGRTRRRLERLLGAVRGRRAWSAPRPGALLFYGVTVSDWG